MATKKTDDQAQAGNELDAGATSAPVAPTAPISPATAAAPAPAAPTSPAVDDFHGQGGEYEIVDGVRRLVSRTEVIDPTRA